jgi:hypothetical protein
MDDWCADDDEEEEEEQQQQQNEKEGRNFRQLFRTDSDSYEDMMLISEYEKTEQGQSPQKLTTVVRKILNVELEESVIGGSIEHRLWPAAEYLASFVLKLCNGDHHNHRDPSLSSPVVSTSSSISDPKSAKKYGTNQTLVTAPEQCSLVTLKRLLQNSNVTADDDSRRLPRLCILELGAGVGLTGLALAMQLKNCWSILLTDLESALPLLQSNVKRNPHTQSPVQITRLEWGNLQDIERVLTTWYHRQNCSITASASSSSSSPPPPSLLILGSDCVYWEHLYVPLEWTIAGLLQQAPCDSMCLLAGMRRWKRDNHFYRRVLGKVSATDKGRLQCTCIDEQVLHRSNNNDNDARSDSRPEQRQVMRIYAIQWIRTDQSKNNDAQTKKR